MCIFLSLSHSFCARVMAFEHAFVTIIWCGASVSFSFSFRGDEKMGIKRFDNIIQEYTRQKDKKKTESAIHDVDDDDDYDGDGNKDEELNEPKQNQIDATVSAFV